MLANSHRVHAKWVCLFICSKNVIATEKEYGWRMHSSSRTAHLILICFALVCVPRPVVVSADWAISRQYCFIVYINFSQYLRSGQIVAERWNQASGSVLYLLWSAPTLHPWFLISNLCHRLFRSEEGCPPATCPCQETLQGQRSAQEDRWASRNMEDIFT